MTDRCWLLARIDTEDGPGSVRPVFTAHLIDKHESGEVFAALISTIPQLAESRLLVIEVPAPCWCAQGPEIIDGKHGWIIDARAILEHHRKQGGSIAALLVGKPIRLRLGAPPSPEGV